VNKFRPWNLSVYAVARHPDGVFVTFWRTKSKS